MSAVDVLALHQWEFDNRYYCKCRALVADHPSDADMAAHQLDALRAAGFAVVRVPDIAYKGPHDTNGSLLITAADKAESARYPVGGSNVGRAVAQVLREVAAAADKVEVPK